MNGFKHLALVVASGVCFAVSAPRAETLVGVNIGPEPACPYGFYDYAPYACAPSGYYGPEWFVDGIFIGAGPWFHGSANFRGHVDNRFDGRYGYRGPAPNRGEAPDLAMHADHMAHFSGNEMREGGGYEGGRRR